MKVAVITPYYRERLSVLRQCHESVARQTWPATHYLVADGFPNDEAAKWPVKHVALSKSHADGGNTPRCIGAISAFNSSFDAVAFLDADNWYAPDHIQSLVHACEQTGAHVAISGRTIVLDNGEVLSKPDPEDAVGAHADTSTYFITGKAAFLAPYWGMMSPKLWPVGDRLIFSLLARFKIPTVRTKRGTLFYRSNYGAHYRMAGLEPPPKVNDIDYAAVYDAFDPQENWARLRIRLGLTDIVALQARHSVRYGV
jgi:glycosyltransferase involved in cell wall biosynthesis